MLSDYRQALEKETIQYFWHVCLVQPHESCSVSAGEVAKPFHVKVAEHMQ